VRLDFEGIAACPDALLSASPGKTTARIGALQQDVVEIVHRVAAVLP
jgi:hypothetical protein